MSVGSRRVVHVFDWDELTELTRKAAGVDARLGVDGELFTAVVALEQARRFVDAAEAHVLAEIDTRGAAEVEFGLVTSTWLAREAALPAAVAKARVRVAKQLRSHLGSVDERLSAGEISWEHARVIAGAASNSRVTDDIVELQDELMDRAEAMVFDRWRLYVNGVVSLLDDDGAFDPNEDLERNHLRLRPGLDDELHLTGTLIGEHGEIVRQAVETRADRLFREFNRDHARCPDIVVPPRVTLLALALAELVREGLGLDPASTAAPRTDITFVVPAGAPQTGFTPNGVRLHDDTIRLLACDAHWHPVVVDSLGVPLDMGREIRFANRAQRRAAAVRDGGCIFPGCDAPTSWTDMHHLTIWGDGGLTNLDAMACLCRRHHGVAHRTGWALHAAPDGWIWFVTPTRKSFWSQRHGQQRTGPPPGG